MLSHRLFAFLSNDRGLGAPALRSLASPLRTAAAGYNAGRGLGWIEEGRALVERTPDPRGEELDFQRSLASLRARVALGVYVTGHGRRRLPVNALPPFRYSGWLFGSAPARRGVLPPETRNELRARTSDHILRALEGESDAELVSAFVFERLHRGGPMASPDYPAQVAVAALGSALRDASLLPGMGDMDLGAVMTNGRVMVAYAHQHALMFKLFKGFSPEPDDEGRRGTDRPHFRAIFVANATQDADAAWATVASGSVLTYVKDIGLVHAGPLDDAPAD